MKITAPNPGMSNPLGTQGLESSPEPPQEFGDVLSKMVNKVNQMQNSADKKITASLQGEEDLHEAMLALEKSGLGLKVLLQVRNKLIQAYEELNRMPL